MTNLDQDALDAQESGRGASRWLTWLVLAGLLVLGTLCSCGCKHIPWPPVVEEPEVDAVAYADLRWVYGGFNGAHAVIDKVDIQNLATHARGLSFNYVTDLSAWGAPHTDWTHALACLFVKGSDGVWRGGKFDWISSSRVTRDFANINGAHAGYGGWTLAGTPNPSEVAFVIVHTDGRRRSNVIKTDWRR